MLFVTVCGFYFSQFVLLPLLPKPESLCTKPIPILTVVLAWLVLGVFYACRRFWKVLSVHFFTPMSFAIVVYLLYSRLHHLGFIGIAQLLGFCFVLGAFGANLFTFPVSVLAILVSAFNRMQHRGSSDRTHDRPLEP